MARGLVTASGGNHGLAVARSAHVRGHVRRTIFLPSNVAPDKVAKLKGWGADVEIVGVGLGRSQRGRARLRRRDRCDLFPSLQRSGRRRRAGHARPGDPRRLPDIDAILVAIGGGGLITGLVRRREGSCGRNLKVIGIEPVGSPTLHACLDAGHVVTLDSIQTRVPTMACRRTDEAIFEAAKRTIDDIVLVTDEDMQEAARWLWFEFGIAADLSGAASIAALRSGKVASSTYGHACALICGAGIDGTG